MLLVKLSCAFQFSNAWGALLVAGSVCFSLFLTSAFGLPLGFLGMVPGQNVSRGLSALAMEGVQDVQKPWALEWSSFLGCSNPPIPGVLCFTLLYRPR